MPTLEDLVLHWGVVLEVPEPSADEIGHLKKGVTMNRSPIITREDLCLS